MTRFMITDIILVYLCSKNILIYLNVGCGGVFYYLFSGSIKKKSLLHFSYFFLDPTGSHEVKGVPLVVKI